MREDASRSGVDAILPIAIRPGPVELFEHLQDGHFPGADGTIEEPGPAVRVLCAGQENIALRPAPTVFAVSSPGARIGIAGKGAARPTLSVPGIVIELHRLQELVVSQIALVILEHLALDLGRSVLRIER